MDPADGRSSPLIRLKRVVLPAPFGPMRATISPSATAKLTRWRTRNPPKLRATSVPSRKGRVIALATLQLVEQCPPDDHPDRGEAAPGERLVEREETHQQHDHGGGAADEERRGYPQAALVGEEPEDVHARGGDAGRRGEPEPLAGEGELGPGRPHGPA